MSIFNQFKPVALLGALVCALFMLSAVTASAADEDSMSHDQKMSQENNMKKDSMAEGDSMKDDAMSEGDNMKNDAMAEGDHMKDDAMSGGDSMAEGDSMKKEEDNM